LVSSSLNSQKFNSSSSNLTLLAGGGTNAGLNSNSPRTLTSRDSQSSISLVGGINDENVFKQNFYQGAKSSKI
jgi:hypothetical protein